MRLAGLAALAFTLALASASPATAHSGIVATYPEDGTVVDGPSVRIEAVFSQELDQHSSLVVLDSAERPVETDESGLDLDDLDHVTLYANVTLGPGPYRVVWNAMSAEDGDSTSGSWGFSVADASGDVPPAAAPPAAGGTAQGGVAWPVVTGLVVVGALAVVGLLVLHHRSRAEVEV